MSETFHIHTSGETPYETASGSVPCDGGVCVGSGMHGLCVRGRSANEGPSIRASLCRRWEGAFKGAARSRAGAAVGRRATPPLGNLVRGRLGKGRRYARALRGVTGRRRGEGLRSQGDTGTKAFVPALGC